LTSVTSRAIDQSSRFPGLKIKNPLVGQAVEA
jgi:hypothetical protein